MGVCFPPWARPRPRRGDPGRERGPREAVGAAGPGRGRRRGRGARGGAALLDVFICNLVLLIVLRRYFESL